MGYLQLRQLFELLCDGLEKEQNQLPLHFEAAYGLEMPSQVLMFFVFREGLICCQFAVQDNYDHPKGLYSSSQSLSLDECLDMTERMRTFTGGMSELFA